MMKSVIISSSVVRVAGSGWVSPNASRRPATVVRLVSGGLATVCMGKTHVLGLRIVGLFGEGACVVRPWRVREVG